MFLFLGKDYCFERMLCKIYSPFSFVVEKIFEEGCLFRKERGPVQRIQIHVYHYAETMQGFFTIAISNLQFTVSYVKAKHRLCST
jgi:hypothetical protein